MPNRIRVLKHEVVPGWGSFEVRLPGRSPVLSLRRSHQSTAAAGDAEAGAGAGAGQGAGAGGEGEGGTVTDLLCQRQSQSQLSTDRRGDQ